MNATAPQPEVPASFDGAAVRQHVEMLHQLAAGIDGVLVVSVFHASPTGDEDRPGTVTHHGVGDVDGMVDAIEAHRDVRGANSYVGLQIMRKTLDRGKRGTEADIVAVLGLVADMDGDTGRAGGLPLEPNLILETSPGNFQPFILFERPLPSAEAKPLARALKTATGSDHGTADIAHVWRIPGTKNWPNKAKLARGRSPDPATVTTAQAWDGTLTSVDDLRSALSPFMAATAEARTVEIGDLPSIDGINISPFAAELLAANDVGDRSEHAARVVEQLAFDGLSAEQGLVVFLSAAGDWLARYSAEERARTDFLRLWGKYGAGHEEMRERGAGLVAGLVAKTMKPVAANDNHPDPSDPWAEAASPALPFGILPPVVEDFARARSEQMGVDRGGLALAALAVCAGAIPDNIQIKVKRYESWTESARIWVALVGEPSTRKSPIIRAASAPLRKIEAELQAEHRDAMQTWSALPKDLRASTAQPTARRVIAEDASPEKIAEILSNNEAGLTLVDDELSGWFARMEKYAGAKGAGADRAFWLKSFGGGPYSVDRIGRGSIWVPNVSVTLLGGIQPDPLRQIASGLSDDGLMQRIFPIMLASAGEDCDEPAAVDEAVFDQLVRDLYGLRTKFMAGLCLRFDEDAQALRTDLAAKHREVERRWQLINKRVATHVGKLDGLFARLALLLHLIQNTGPELPREICAETATQASRLIHEYLLPHARSLHVNVLGATDVHDGMLDAAGSILTNTNLSDEVSARALARHGTRRLRDAEPWEMERILQRLDAYSWIEPRPMVKNETAQHYKVNPRVHQKFADRGKGVAVQRAAVREEIRRALAV